MVGGLGSGVFRGGRGDRAALEGNASGDYGILCFNKSNVMSHSTSVTVFGVWRFKQQSPTYQKSQFSTSSISQLDRTGALLGGKNTGIEAPPNPTSGKRKKHRSRIPLMVKLGRLYKKVSSPSPPPSSPPPPPPFIIFHPNPHPNGDASRLLARAQKLSPPPSSQPHP